MTKKLPKIFLIIPIFILVLFLNPIDSIFAKNTEGIDIPEKDGIYNVPGHPELKVRVFVHKANPRPNPQPLLQCGLSDLGSSAVVDSAGWKLPTNWTYNLNPSSVPSSVGSENLVTMVNNAFEEWTTAINNKVTIIKGSDTSINRKGLDGKNIITWGRASGSALGVTYIWYNPTTKVVTELDTIMNQKFIWMWSGGGTDCAYTNSYDAQNILIHELGHWFGLDDEYTSNYENNTMYGYGSKMEVSKNTLTIGDINGIKAIY